MRAPVVALTSVCLVLAGCGGGAEEKAEPGRPMRPLGPGQVVKRADSLKQATVRGRAYPVGGDRIVLAGPEQSIFAFADAAVVRDVEKPGQTLVLSGPVRRLSEAQARELDADVADIAPAQRSPEVERARRAAGAPYVEVERTGP